MRRVSGAAGADPVISPARHDDEVKLSTHTPLGAADSAANSDGEEDVDDVVPRSLVNT